MRMECATGLVDAPGDLFRINRIILFKCECHLHQIIGREKYT
jgi:hypothetical protein